MLVLIDVTIPGCPTSQRSQVVVRRTKDGRHFGSLAKDARTEEWRSIARLTIAEAWAGKPPINVPVVLLVEAVAQRPQSIPKRLGTGRLWLTRKPDWDNIGKGTDAIVKAGVLSDDVLVVDARVLRYVAAVDEAPFTRFVVSEVDPLPIVPWPAKARAGKSTTAGTLL